MIIRYMTVRVDEDRKKAEAIKAKREARNSKKTAKFRNTEEAAEAPAEA
ncbi:MAG: hypothetical protein IPG67_01730 [Acidobacteria bacterium]|nr:hypothetical protein [Acidobacteriota bacterium]